MMGFAALYPSYRDERAASNRGKTTGTGYRVLPNAGDQASKADKILGLAPVRRGGAVP
jgi:hypothetical protein